MASIWDLNAIVLAHTQRFFQAVTCVVDNWVDPDRAFLGSVTALLGNLVWAASSFQAKDIEQEKAMAYGGALAGTLGGDLPAGDSLFEQQAELILAAQERQLYTNFDQLLKHLQAQLKAEGLGNKSPAKVNAWVWERLFPHYTYGMSQVELQEAIKVRLRALT